MALLFGLCLAGLADAAREYDPPAGLVGLLSPALVADGPEGCLRVDTRTRLPLHSAPSTATDAIGWLAFEPWRDVPGECAQALPRVTWQGDTDPIDPPRYESGYEVLALAVLERRDDWLRLNLGQGSGWLRQPADYTLDAYPALLTEKLAYATAAWAGQLCDRDGNNCRTVEPTAEQPLQVLSVGGFGEDARLEVELTSDGCRDGKAEVLAHGWIRAYANDGRPTVWFHSRGC